MWVKVVAMAVALVSSVLLAGCVAEPAVDPPDATPAPGPTAEEGDGPAAIDPPRPANRSAEPRLTTNHGEMTVFFWNPNLPPVSVGEHGPYNVDEAAAANGIVVSLEWDASAPLTEQLVIQTDHQRAATSGPSPLRLVLAPPIDAAVRIDVYPFPVSGHGAAAVHQEFALTLVTFQDSVFDANATA